jgi:hypothetical protein
VVPLDLNMPTMGGLAVLERLNADATLPGTPVVVFTTSSPSFGRSSSPRSFYPFFFFWPLRFFSKIPEGRSKRRMIAGMCPLGMSRLCIGTG